MGGRVEKSAWASFWETVFRFQMDKLSPWLAVRNTVGVALPLVVGVALGQVPAGLAMATGALNVSFSDGQEPYRQRGRRMLAASMVVAFALFAGTLSGHHNFAAVMIAALWAFAAGMMVALSTTAGDLGTISLVTLVVYMAVPQSFERAVYGSLLAFCGGLLQTLLAVAFWPLHRYIYEQRAVGDLYAELARTAAAPVKATEAPPASAQSTAAQNALSALSRDHSIEAERIRMLLAEAERLRLVLMMMGRLRIRIEREGGPESAVIERAFEVCARVLGSIARALQMGAAADGNAGSLEELEQLSEKLRSCGVRTAEVDAMLRDARAQLDALTGQLRTAVEMAGSMAPAGLAEFERRESRRPRQLRLGGTLATLRANLTLESAAFRHAVRLAVSVAVGTALAHGLALRRSYWVPMTIAIVLKPDFTATFSRGVLRLAGTIVGLVLATALFHVLPQQMFVEVALIAASMFLMRYVGPANYGLFVTAVTSLVVWLIAMTGVAPQPVMAARALNTAAGGAIALLAYWLWPTWERTQAPEAIARMLDAYRAYFRAVRLGYENPDGSGGEADRDRVRLPGRLARSNAEASIDRLFAEPGTPPGTRHRMSGMMASSHRMVHAIMALEAGLYSSLPVPPRPEFRRFADDVELTLYYLAASLRGSAIRREELPDLREDHHALVHAGDPHVERYALVNMEADRITNSLNTLSEEMLGGRAEGTGTPGAS